MVMACAPSRYLLDVEMRYPSRSGVDLTGKNVTIAYGQEGMYPNDVFIKSMAESFAKNIKDKYHEAIGSVEVCRLGSAPEYANRDSMLNLLISTGADAVFLLDKVDFNNSSFSFILKCYDGMNQEDKVELFSGNSVADALNGDADVMADGREAGKKLAAAFELQWKPEQYSLYYYGSEEWYAAIEKAEAFDWKGAMDIWMNRLSVDDPLKRACAAYNIATACYMMGDCHLALQWLDIADENADLLVSAGLRKRINSSLQGRR